MSFGQFSFSPRTITKKRLKSAGVRFSIAGALLALALGSVAFAPVTGVEARNAGTAPYGGVYAPSTSFLTLPFYPTETMNILSGWYYSGSGGSHGGIDFINGTVNQSRWSTFPIIASADGYACGNCTSRQGNAVWIKHNVGGQIYYTYYGHLASFAPDIPLGSQSRTVWVKRGQIIGWAGSTGVGSALHLHFALYNAASQPLDPYSIGKLRQYYPKPDQERNIGWFIKPQE